MRESRAVRDAWVRFCDAISTNDSGRFDELISPEFKIVIGTGPDEIVRERELMRGSFENSPNTLESLAAEGYEEGRFAWLTDQVIFRLTEGDSLHSRVTAVFHEEEESWRLVHAHFSVGVPEDEVVELQKKWSSQQ